MVAIFRNGVRAVCIKSNAMGFLAEKGVAQLISKHGPDFVFFLVLKINIYIYNITIYILIYIYVCVNIIYIYIYSWVFTVSRLFQTCFYHCKIGEKCLDFLSYCLMFIYDLAQNSTDMR